MMKCLSKFKSKTFRCGTSLLEVVVATGVIATGMAVILPAVGNIRESSQSLTCKDHQRTLGQAHLGYSLDNLNRFVGRKELAGSQPAWFLYSWTMILNEDYFGDAPVGDVNGNYSWSPVNTGTIRWIGNPVDGTYIKNQVWCPSVRGIHLNSFRCYPMNRYAANGSNTYGSNDTLEIISSRDSHPKFKRVILGVKTSKYKNPSLSVLHHEAINSNDWTSNYAGSDQPLYLIDSLQDSLPGAASTTGIPSTGTYAIPWHFRHNLRMNMLYMDSHVGTEAFASEGLNTAERYRYD